jgi:hypothetical protein
VAQLVEFCNELSREVLSADAAFNQDTSYLISDIIEDSDELDFVIVITTDRLIKLAPAKANVHADDTHKVVVENLPFNVAGWNDKSRTFHPSVGGLCSHVDHVRYARLFKIWKENHGSLDPDMTLADAAEAIPNGAKETWLDILRRLMCFPHVSMVRNLAVNLN